MLPVHSCTSLSRQEMGGSPSAFVRLLDVAKAEMADGKSNRTGGTSGVDSSVVCSAAEGRWHLAAVAAYTESFISVQVQRSGPTQHELTCDP